MSISVPVTEVLPDKGARAIREVASIDLLGGVIELMAVPMSQRSISESSWMHGELWSAYAYRCSALE